MKVLELMESNPATVGPDDPLGTALKVMAENSCRHLAVLEGENVVGIISDRDLALFYDPVNMTEEKWNKARVRDLMAHEPTTIGSQAPASEAAKLLLKEGFSALLIVDMGNLVGILTDRDFVQYFADKGL